MTEPVASPLALPTQVPWREKLRDLSVQPWLVQFVWCLAFIPYVVAGVVSMARFMSGRNTGNLLDFLEASRAMLHHRDIYASGLGGYVYPPLIAFLYQPLALLPNTAAAVAMLGIEVATGVATLIFVSRVLVFRLLGSADPLLTATAALIGAVLTADKIKGEFAHLETNVFMLLAYTSAMRYVDRRPGLCGLALGFAFNIKYLPVVLVPWLLLRRRWRATLWFGVFAVGFAALPALSMGWRADLHTWAEALGGIGRLFGVHITTVHVAKVRLIVDSVSISATSGLARVTGLRPIQAELVSTAIALLMGVFLVVEYARGGLRWFRWPDPRTQQGAIFRVLFTAEWLELLLIVLALSPFTNSRHLYMLLDVNVAAAVLLLGTGGTVNRLPLFAATVLLWIGVTFPPGGTARFETADQFWRTVGGPGWCMLAMAGALIWTTAKHARALRAASEYFRQTPGGRIEHASARPVL